MYSSGRLTTIIFVVNLLFCFAPKAAETVEDSASCCTKGGVYINNSNWNAISRQTTYSLPWTEYKELIEIYNSIISINREDPQKYDLYFQGMPDYATSYLLYGMEINDPFTGHVSMPTGRYAIDRLSISDGFSSVFTGAPFVVAENYDRNEHNRLSGKIDLMTDNISGDSYDRNIYSGFFTVPLGANGAITFNGERRWYGDRAPSVKTENIYESFGLDTSMTNPQRLGGNWWSNYNYGVSGFYQVHRRLTLSAAFQTSRDRWSEYLHGYLEDLPHTPRTESDNILISGELTWRSSGQLEITAGGGYFSTKTTTGDGTQFDDIPSYQRAISNPSTDGNDLFYTGDSPYAASYLDSTITPGSEDDTTVYVAHYYPDVSKHGVGYYETHIRSFFGDYSKNLSMGVSYRKYAVRNLYFENATLGYSPVRVNNYGYDSLGNKCDSDVRKPHQFSIFAGGKLSRGIVTFTGSLRLDSYQYDGFNFRDLTNPLDPFQETGSNSLDRSDYKKTENYTRLSPRLGLEVLISREFKAGLSFGSIYRLPPFQYLYCDLNWFASRINAGRLGPFPISEVEPVKYKEMDIHLNYTISDGMGAGIEYYNRNSGNEISPVYQTAVPYYYYYYGNDDDLESQGINISLFYFRDKHFDFRLNYSYCQTTLVTGSFPGYDLPWNPSSHTRFEITSSHNRAHSVTLIAGINTNHFLKGKNGVSKGIFKNMRFYLIGRYYEGIPYTPTEMYLSGIEGINVSIRPTGNINSKRFPNVSYVDLKIEKQVRTEGITVSPYILIKNLFNKENITYTYSATGSPNNDGWLESEEGELWASEHPDQARLYSLKNNDPRHYGSPRIIYIGLSVSL